MAITVNFNGATLRKPGVYSKTTVSLSGGFPLAPAGIIGIIGEAAGGAPGSATDIKVNSFSPEQFSEIVSNYKSGPLVDACALLFAPSADARIPNGAQAIFIYKTNASTQASATLASSYGTVKSLNYGLDENLINYEVTAGTAEALWSSGSLNLMIDGDAGATLKVRIDGGAEQNAILAANDTNTSAAASIAALTGLATSGGADRGVLTASQVTTGTLALSSTGNVVTITIASNTWAVNPAVGDTLQIRTGSILAGAGNENRGAYLITAVTSTVITAVKLSDPSVACLNIAAADILATTDLLCYSPVVITQDSVTATGSGASAELFDGGASVAVEEVFYGGTNRNILSTTKVDDGSTIGLSVSGSVGTFTISSSWAGTMSPGDILWVRPGSVLAGATRQNIGAWRVTASSSTSITATKIAGTPVTVAATDILATTDVVVFKGILSSTAAPIVNTSSSELSRLITINRQSDSLTEESGAIGGNVALTIGYLGTTATVSVTSTKLTTTVVGGSGANLNITLASYKTLNDLAAFINAQTGYSCAVGNALFGQLAPSALDRVSAVGIAAGISGDKTGRIKKDSKEVQDFFDTSVLVGLTRTLFVGLPTTTTSKVFLSGGAVGGTTAASVQAGFDALQKVRVNSVVPLFSRDASTDILDSLTDTSSTYTVDAVHAALRTHLLLMSNTKNRSERNGYASFKGTYVDSKSKANGLANERVSMCIQDVKMLKTDGTLAFVQPWGLACLAAGMQAGAPVGEPMTHKSINISGITHTEFDPETQGDDAIQSGILYVEQPQSGGFRIKLGNTTYGRDSNFVFNRISVLYAADTYAYSLRQSLDAAFVGVSSATATPTSVKNAVVQFSQAAKDAGLIVGDDTNEGLGFKNLVVKLNGNVMTVDITITPAQGIDFILPSIVLDNIRATA